MYAQRKDCHKQDLDAGRGKERVVDRPGRLLAARRTGGHALGKEAALAGPHAELVEAADFGGIGER